MCRACTEDRPFDAAGTCFECDTRVCVYDERHATPDGTLLCGDCCGGLYPEHVCSWACQPAPDAARRFDATFAHYARVGATVVRVF